MWFTIYNENRATRSCCERHCLREFAKPSPLTSYNLFKKPSRLPASHKAGFKVLTFLSLNFYEIFGYGGSTEQNATDEQNVMEEKGDTEVSAAILGRHLTVYKRSWDSCLV